jgi:hypothetical protein
MKKFLAIFLVVAMMCSLCACGVKSVEVEEENRVAKGYAIIQHWDGEEYIEFYENLANNGIIAIWTMDGRKIVSTNITLMFY